MGISSLQGIVVCMYYIGLSTVRVALLVVYHLAPWITLPIPAPLGLRVWLWPDPAGKEFPKPQTKFQTTNFPSDEASIPPRTRDRDLVVIQIAPARGICSYVKGLISQ
jgi:hypothetical protein